VIASKETYKHINTVKKQQKKKTKEKPRASVGYMSLCCYDYQKSPMNLHTILA